MSSKFIFICLIVICRDFFASHTYVVPEIFSGYSKHKEILMPSGTLYVIYEKSTELKNVARCMRTYYSDGRILEIYINLKWSMIDASQALRVKRDREN